MKLYWCPQTRAARAVWMLEEAGVEYDRELIDIRSDAAKQHAGFRRASPMGKVPALEDGDARVADSAAICLYLADRYAAGSLAPATDAPERGEFLFWMFFAPAVMEPCMAEKFGTAQPNRAAHGWGDFATMVDALDARLDGHEWLLGDWFTAADVMVGSTANFMKMFDIMPDSRRIAAYIDRCLARPAYKRALEIDAAAALQK